LASVDAGYVNISVADISEHRLEERWYHVSSAVVGRSTRDSRNDSVSMRVKTQYQTVNILPLNYYDPLLQVVYRCFTVLVFLVQRLHFVIVSVFIWCLQCFDAVGWVAGRASGL